MLNRQTPCNALRSFKEHNKAFQFTLFVIIFFICAGCGDNGSRSNNNTVDIAQEGTTSTVLEIQSISTQAYEPESPLDLPTPTPTSIPTPTTIPLSEMTIEERDKYLWSLYDEIMIDLEIHVEDLLERGEYFGDGAQDPPWLASTPTEFVEARYKADREEVVGRGYLLAGQLKELPYIPLPLARLHPELIDALELSSDSINDGVGIRGSIEELYYLFQLYDAIEGGYIIYDESSEDTNFELEEYLAGNLQKKSNNGLTIVEVNKVDEYVIIANASKETTDLEGWTLLSERGTQTWTIPTSFLLHPGEQVTIYAGVGQAHEYVLYSGFNSNIWNNSEPDTAVLLNPEGAEISRR